MNIFPPLILIKSPSDGENCTTLLLSGRDTFSLKPPLTPSDQKIFVLSQWEFFPMFQISNLKGFRVVIGVCNSSDYYVKSEFELEVQRVPSSNLIEKLPGDVIDMDRSVILGTSNCSIFSATGPIVGGKPLWMDGVELKGVTTVLESSGLNWQVQSTDEFKKYLHDMTEMEKLKWIVVNGYVDIAFCNFWHIIGTRVDVLNPWHRSCSRLLVPRPQKKNPYWHSIFLPLSLEFWLIVLLCDLVTAFSITILSTFQNIRHQRKHGKISLVDSTFEAVSLLILGTGVQIRKRMTLRIIGASWGLFVLIGTAAYSSSLASILTTPVQDDVPQTIEQLLEKGYVWVNGLKSMVDPRDHFQTQSGVDMDWIKAQTVYSDDIKDKITILGEELGDVFFITDTEAVPRDFLNTLMVSKECLASYHVSIVTRKRSPYFEYISSGFSRLAESGVLSKMLLDSLQSPKLNKYVISNGKKQIEAKLGGIPLSLGSLRGAFFILLGGHFLATIVLFVEIRWFSIVKRRKAKRKLIQLQDWLLD